MDQKRNIGTLVLERARAAGMDVAYLPGLSMKRARDMFPGVAKTDETDAEVIARTAVGMPWALRPVADEGDAGAEIRLRSVLLEADPAFEAAVDLGLAWQVGVLAELSGPVGIVAGGRRRYRRLAVDKAGAPAARADELWGAAKASAESGGFRTASVDVAAATLAKRISDDLASAAAVESAIGSLLSGNAVYRSLLSVPGIGPKTASALVAGVDIRLFESHDKLASFTGLAPCNRQSGSSLDSASSSRAGNKELKNPPIFSCNSLVGTKGEFGRYYDACRERGMRHNKALKAVARKRLKVIYAVMRDTRPHVRA
ncbi:transposase [Gordonibacter sp. RACS_AR68]|uniref:transposase n=1 Tax=Gordonibacter sp. RACS_AR68 TaxID=2872005 RepID=UPI0026040A54|nr:transposase [Gordonibacter sp. RACS_AR68]MDN4470366.1 transposase [Gordonibacter sp. RACS_AR68]